MSYEIGKLRGFNERLVTDAAPLVTEFSISSVDFGMLWLAVTVTVVNGADPYANCKIQTTFNGTDWEDVLNAEYEPVTGLGVFKQYFTALTGIVAPLCRLVVTASAGCDIFISDISRGVWTEEGAYPGRVQSPSGGSSIVTIGAPKGTQAAADSLSVTSSLEDRIVFEDIRDKPTTFVLDAVLTDVEQDTATPANNLGLPSVLLGGQGKEPIPTTVRNNFTVEMYAGLLPERWNGLTVAYPLTTQETYEFFEDVAKTISICVVTVDYVDATKEQLSSVTRV